MCTRKNTKRPLSRVNTVPEVGLELYSSPCKHWDSPGNMRNPARSNPSTAQSETQSVDIVHTHIRPSALPKNRVPLRERGFVCAGTTDKFALSWLWMAPPARNRSPQCKERTIQQGRNS